MILLFTVLISIPYVLCLCLRVCWLGLPNKTKQTHQQANTSQILLHIRSRYRGGYRQTERFLCRRRASLREWSSHQRICHTCHFQPLSPPRTAQSPTAGNASCRLTMALYGRHFVMVFTGWQDVKIQLLTKYGFYYKTTVSIYTRSVCLDSGVPSLSKNRQASEQEGVPQSRSSTNAFYVRDISSSSKTSTESS